MNRAPPLSLPPLVEGSSLATLTLTCDQIVWHTPDDAFGPHPLDFGFACVRVVWFGEDGCGTLFKPSLEGTPRDTSQDFPDSNNTVAYPVKCSIKHLAMYLKDMGNAVFDVFHFEISPSVMDLMLISEIFECEGSKQRATDDKQKLHVTDTETHRHGNETFRFLFDL